MSDLCYFSQKEVAEKLGISPKTLEAMRQKGNGPRFSKFGRRVLYHLAELEAYLASRSYASTSEY